jgi:hypothetical protein
MPAKTLEDYWNLSFDTLYDACFYELASEHVIRSWNLIDLVISLCTAFIIAGSAVSGWALWENPNGKLIWGCIAAAGSALAIFHGILAVPRRITREAERQQRFSALKADLVHFRANLTRGLDVSKAQKRFDVLREKLRSNVSKTPPDIVLTQSARQAIQKSVNNKLKRDIGGRSHS